MDREIEKTHRFRKLGRSNPDAMWETLGAVEVGNPDDPTDTATPVSERPSPPAARPERSSRS